MSKTNLCVVSTVGSRRLPRTGLALVTSAMLWASPAVCQQQERSPRVAEFFEAARIAAEVEHDPTAAITWYEQILIDASLSSEDAARANLALADLRRSIGDKAGAAKALAAAAAGQGAAAVEAQQRLSVSDEVVRRITSCLQQVMAGDKSKVDELIWIGAPAVPLTIEWVDRAASYDFEFVTACAVLLAQLRGPAVEAWFARVPREYSAIAQRAVLRGLRDENMRNQWVENVVAASWLGEATDLAAIDREVFEDLVTMAAYGIDVFSHAQVLELTRSPEARRAAAGRKLLGRWEDLRGDGRTALLGRLAESMRERAADFTDQEFLRAMHGGFQRGFLPAEREFFLDVIVLPEAARPAQNFDLNDFKFDRAESIGPRDHADSVLRAARKLPPIDGEATNPQGALRAMFWALLGKWDESAIDVVFDMVELGYARGSNYVERYLQEHARGDAQLRMLQLLDQIGDASVLTVVEPRPELIEPLREALRSLGHDESGSDAKSRFYLVASVVEKLLSIDTPEAARAAGMYVRETADRSFWRPQPPTQLVRTFAQQVPMNGSSFLQEVAVVPITDEYSGELRTAALEALMVTRDPSAPKLFARFFEDVPDADDAIVRRLQIESLYMLAERDVALAEFAAHVAGASLATHTASAWRAFDRDGWRQNPQVVGVMFRNRDHATPTLRDQILKAALLHTELAAETRDETIATASSTEDRELQKYAFRAIRRHGFTGTEVNDAVEVGLQSEDNSVFDAAASCCSGVPTSPRFVELLTANLQSQDGARRRNALNGLRSIDRDEAVRAALQHGDDAALQSTIIQMATETLDPRLAPQLVSYLRDASLRESAQSALDAIRSYHEETARWQRILSGAGFGSASAAEALAQQVRESGDPTVRRLAVESLGTLGAPETLPFLIELLRDADAAVATAARAAIDKINSRPQAQKGGEAPR